MAPVQPHTWKQTSLRLWFPQTLEFYPIVEIRHLSLWCSFSWYRGSICYVDQSTTCTYRLLALFPYPFISLLNLCLHFSLNLTPLPSPPLPTPVLSFTPCHVFACGSSLLTGQDGRCIYLRSKMTENSPEHRHDWLIGQVRSFKGSMKHECFRIGWYCVESLVFGEFDRWF